jgi:hypothetical protein
MTMSAQVLLGSFFLTLCALGHVGMVALSIPFMSRAARAMSRRAAVLRSGVLLAGAVFAVLVAHTVQIWVWAAVLLRVGAFPDLETSFYFATVTYTTLGYGDLLLGEGLRIFATFGAITGLLTFGISTAFLIAVLGRLLPGDTEGQPRL